MIKVNWVSWKELASKPAIQSALKTRIAFVHSINLDDARALIDAGFIVVIVR